MLDCCVLGRLRFGIGGCVGKPLVNDYLAVNCVSDCCLLVLCVDIGGFVGEPQRNMWMHATRTGSVYPAAVR